MNHSFWALMHYSILLRNEGLFFKIWKKNNILHLLQKTHKKVIVIKHTLWSICSCKEKSLPFATAYTLNSKQNCYTKEQEQTKIMCPYEIFEYNI